MRVRFAEVLRADSRERFIAREAQIANRKFMLGEPVVQHGLPHVVMLHSLAKCIADQANVVALLKL